MKRYFQLVTHLAFPADLISMAPGKPGDVVELDAERCKLFGRFLRLRTAAGDLAELDGPPPLAAATAPAAPLASQAAVPSSPVPSSPVPAHEPDTAVAPATPHETPPLASSSPVPSASAPKE